MDLSDLLIAESVRVLPDVTSKKRLIQALAELAHERLGLAASTIFDALQERESLGPTGVGGGVAIPHARLDSLDDVHGVFVKLNQPVAFDAVDRKPVDLVFALFAPQESGVEHLKALALVSRTMRDAALCEKLRANSDPATLHTILTNRQGSAAA